MKRSIRFTVCLIAGLCAGPAFTQAPSDEAISETTTSPPVAYAYVQTNSGVNVYAATAVGTLSLVKGSPFSTVGEMEDINGKYLISVGTTSLFVYPIESTGAVGKLASSIDTQSYGGSECGDTNGGGSGAGGSVLDHSGKYLYVQLYNFYNCAAWQSYKVESDGSLLFIGDVEYYDTDDGGDTQQFIPSSVPTISSNDKFGYGWFFDWAGSFSTFIKKPDGQLEVNNTFTEVDPANKPGSPFSFFPAISQADPESHLAVLMQSVDGSSDDLEFGPDQLASYTINDSTGSVISTNTWKNMPVLAGSPSSMSMSPSGKILAVAVGTGIQFFHFNGANPITKFTGIIGLSGYITAMQWDKSNHLYAINGASGNLHVYTVTISSVKRSGWVAVRLSAPKDLSSRFPELQDISR